MSDTGPSGGGANLSPMTAFSNSANFNKFIDQVPKHLSLLDQAVHTLQTRVDTANRSFVQAIGELTTKHTAESARLDRQLHTVSLAITNQLQYLSQNAASLGGDFGNVALGSKDGQVTQLVGRKVLAPQLDVHGNFSLFNDAVSTTVPIFSVSTSGVLTAQGVVVSGAPVAVASGGTNSGTALSDQRIMVSLNGRIIESAALSDGDFLIGATGGAPSVGSLTSSNLAIGKSAGGISVNAPQSIATTASPSFAALTLASPLTPASGGTGLSSFTIGDLLAGNDTGTLTVVPSNKTVVKKFLTQTGTGASSVAPSWIAISGADLTGDINGRSTNVTGVVAVANGGTNSSTVLSSNRVMVSVSGAIREAAQLLAGQFLAGNSSGVPTVTGLAGTAKRILIALANGSITLSTPQDIDVDSVPQFGGVLLSQVDAGSSGTLTVGGDSTSTLNLANGSVPQVLNLGGGAGQTTINLGGGENDVINFLGTVNNVAMQNNYVQNKNFLLNQGGSAGSGGGAGIDVQENGTVTAYWRISNDESSILMKAPGSPLMTFNQSLSTTDSATLAALTLATALGIASGGTGFSSYSLGDTLYGDPGKALSKLAGNISTSRRFLTQTGTGTASAAPAWTDLALSDVAGLVFPVSNGGTGRNSYAIGDMLVASSTSALGIVNGAAGVGNVMLSAASGGIPTFGKVGLTTHVSGVLPVANGGTSFNAYTPGQLLYASSGTALARLNGNTSATVMFLTQTGTGTASAAPVWTALLLAGEASGAFGSTTLSNAAVIAKVLTGFTAAAGTVGATDSILQALQKLAGTLGTPTSSNAFGEIVQRDSLGNITVTTVNGSVTGSAATFTTALTGEVTGGANGGATTVAQVGGQTASAVAQATTAVAAATDQNQGGTLVRRTAGGSASLNVVGDVTGNVSGSASTFTVALSGDVVGGASGGATTVAGVGGKTAAAIAGAVASVNAATPSATASTLVSRNSAGASNLSGLGLTSTSNQMTLGTTATTTLSAVAPVASVTYTIIDTGVNSSFVMADGAQTINGSKTFSTAIAAGSGGTGQSSYTTGDLLYASSPSALSKLSAGAVNTLLTSAGAGVAPAWALLNLAASAAGILPVANGGTNSGTALNNNRLMVSSNGAIVEAAALTNGQLLIGSTGAAPVAATLAGTANQITVTPGAGSLVLALPQAIAVTSSPTFASIRLTGQTQGSVLFTGTGGAVSQNNANFFWDDTNARLGLGTSAPAARFHVSGNASLPAWTSNGVCARWDAATYTDTSSSGAVPLVVVSAQQQSTLAASSATTYAIASSMYIAGPPVQGTNVTITKALALHVAAGNSFLGGNVEIASASKVFTGGSDLVFEQTGDTYGTTRVRLQNRDGVNGALFEQAGLVNLVDFVFKTPSVHNAQNIRFEQRNNGTQCESTLSPNVAGEFQLGAGATPSFATGPVSTFVNGAGRFGIGVSSPAAQLHMNQNVSASAWGLNGIGLRIDSNTFTDTTSTTATASNLVAVNAMMRPTLATSSATSFAQAATLYIEPPVTSGSAEIRLPFGMQTSGAIGAREVIVAPPSGTNVYAAGTISQSALVVTGSGTAFALSMVGGSIYFPTNGVTALVTLYTSATQVSVSVSQTISAGSAYSITTGPRFYSGGTVAGTAGSATVTGTGTNWASTLADAVFMTPAGFRARVLTVASATSMTLSAPLTAALTSGSSYTVFVNGVAMYADQLITANVVVTGSMTSTLKVLTASTPVLDTDYAFVKTGTAAVTLTIPAAATANIGRQLLIVNHGTVAVTLSQAYTTASGTTTTSIAAGVSVQIMSDGSVWHRFNV